MWALSLRILICLICSLSVVGLLTGLSGCATIEHRSEAPEKESLPALTSNIHAKPIWSNSESRGIGKSDARLKPAMTNESVIIADHKGRIYAFNRATGAVVWKVETEASITAGPTVGKDYVFVGTRQGEILAFKAKDGSKLWRVPLSGEVLASPTIGGNHLFVHALDGSVTALSLEEGRTLWRYSSTHTPSIVLRQSSSPVLAGNQVIVGFSNGKLRSFNAFDGTVLWEREVGAPKGRSDVQRMADISADPIVINDIVYAVSLQGNLAAVSLETGFPVWERTISSYAGMSYAKDKIYISEVDGSIQAVDRKTGKTLWQQKSLKGHRLTAPAILGNSIIVGDDEGYLHWISGENGSFTGRDRMDSKGIDATPVVLGNTLIVLGRSGKLAVLR